MESSLITLSRYRFETARSDYESAKALYDLKQFRASINRSYYSIFHALRAVLALDGYDSSKHSGIISYFNQHYVKEGIFDKRISKQISSTFNLREKADYEDFFIACGEDAQLQLGKADAILHMIEEYLLDRWEQVDKAEE